MEKYKEISPYSDEQAREAFARIAKHPMLPVASMFLFPNQPINTFNKLIKGIKTVDEFQSVVMERLVSACIVLFLSIARSPMPYLLSLQDSSLPSSASFLQCS